MYKILRNFLFLLPAEAAHSISMKLLKAACSVGFIQKALEKKFSCQLNSTKNQSDASSKYKPFIFGLQFKNPVGLGAGFDKNAHYLRELETLGFGFVEIGTVTPKPQSGNEKPRLFRLPKDQALINRMGFNNEGVEVVAERLRKWKELSMSRKSIVNGQSPIVNGQYSPLTIHYSPMIIAGNIGKNKSTLNEDAWKDYLTCFRALHPYVDFFVVNVSSPNTPGLRELQEKDALLKIFRTLQEENERFELRRPILLKIAPDLNLSQVDEVIEIAKEIRLEGIVVSNTTIARENLKTSSAEIDKIGMGGLSGKPLQKRSTELVQYIWQKTRGSLPIIASGGIFTGEDAREKFSSGASLVEVWTGFIYEGPFIVKKICKKLA